MADTPNPPDRDDSIAERAASMDRRPASPDAGAGRAVNAAFSRNRTTSAGSGGGIGGDARDGRKGDQQQEGFQGAGYPTEDRDDVDPKPGTGDQDGYRTEDDEVEDEDDDGYRRNEEAEGLETGDGMLEQLMTPPGGDALGGDRDTDPNLNGGHGIRMQAPEEGDRPIEIEDTEDSLIGHGHEDKAAWNRERVAHLREMETDEPSPATSRQMGAGGAVLGGVLEGWEGGMESPTVAQGVDPAFDDELSETEEIQGDITIGDMPEDVLDDESINDPNNTPRLPEHRDLPDDNVSREEQLLATPGEDVLSSGAELGVVEELDMEDLNETDNIEEAWEDARFGRDDAMDGNERRGGVEDDDR